MWSANSALSGPVRPSHAARMRRIRPRGESISTPSTAYVGQLGRQKPQWTHRCRRSFAGASPLRYSLKARGETVLANDRSSGLEDARWIEGRLEALHEEIAS